MAERGCPRIVAHLLPSLDGLDQLHYLINKLMDSILKMMPSLAEYKPTMSSMLLTASLGLVTAMGISKVIHDRANYKRFTLPDLVLEIAHAKQPIEKISRTILITGGNGFLGRYIVQRLQREAGVNIIVLDVVIPAAADRHPNVSYARANLLKVDQLESVFAAFKIDSVLHVASIIPFLGVPDRALWMVNVQGTRNIVDVASRNSVKSFLYTSSATVVLPKDDPNSRQLREETSPYPAKHMDKYTTYKEEAERIVKMKSDINGMVCCSLRPSAIFGRGDKLVADACLTGVNAVIIGYRHMQMDWVAVESVAEGHALAEIALQDPAKRKIMHGQEYFIGSNEEITYGDFFGLGAKDETSHWLQPCAQQMPIWLVDTLAQFNGWCTWLLGFPLLPPGLSSFAIAYTRRHYTFSSDKARQHFQYKPLSTTREAIRRLAEEHQAAEKIQSMSKQG
jgi:3beta-hydroxy-Delta5-steroid dehydrogenase / steroid Delta-isomerase